jgi:hypothetical protein
MEERALAKAGKTRNSPFLRGEAAAATSAAPEPSSSDQPDSIQSWIETVATGQINVSTPADAFSDVALGGSGAGEEEEDAEGGIPLQPLGGGAVEAGPGEVVVSFDCSAAQLGVSFYEGSLALATVDAGSPAASNPAVRVGDTLVAVQGHRTAGLSHAEVCGLLRRGGRPLTLTLRRGEGGSAATRGGGGLDEGGPVRIAGDLLKIEPNPLGFITGDTSREAHVRYFVVRADHITYIRGIGSEVVLPFSLIHGIQASDVPANLSIADLAFSKPSEPAALFTITMNEKYRKPFRVYMVQAPSIDARDQWVRVCQQANREHKEFGPWRARRNHDASSVCRCMVARTRRVESAGMFERDYVLYVLEAETRGGDTFQIERRYSDFVSFHERWMEKLMSPYAPLPELPVLDSIKDKNDPSVVIHRMMLLGSYHLRRHIIYHLRRHKIATRDLPCCSRMTGYL